MSWVTEKVKQEQERQAAMLSDRRPRYILPPPTWLPTREKIVAEIRQVVRDYNRAQGKELYDVRVTDQIQWRVEVFPLPVPGFNRIATVTLFVSDTGKLSLTTPPEGEGVNRRGDFQIQGDQIMVLPNFTGNPEPPKAPMTPEQFARDTMEPLLFPEVRKAAARN